MSVKVNSAQVKGGSGIFDLVCSAGRPAGSPRQHHPNARHPLRSEKVNPDQMQCNNWKGMLSFLPPGKWQVHWCNPWFPMQFSCAQTNTSSPMCGKVVQISIQRSTPRSVMCHRGLHALGTHGDLCHICIYALPDLRQCCGVS